MLLTRMLGRLPSSRVDGQVPDESREKLLKTLDGLASRKLRMQLLKVTRALTHPLCRLKDVGFLAMLLQESKGGGWEPNPLVKSSVVETSVDEVLLHLLQLGLKEEKKSD